MQSISDSSQIQITVIIPIRINDAHIGAVQRLSHVKQDETFERYARVLVVDDGSTTNSARSLSECCKDLGFDYVRLDTEDLVFSIGRCRNEGAMRSKTRYIFFQDVDLVPTSGFYKKLAREIDIVGLPSHNNNLIMIPVAYLTERATETFLADGMPGKFQRYMDVVIHRDRDVFEKFSTGTSACLYDRYYYLSCGGNIDAFSGWGFEDLEFNSRVVLDSRRYPEPANWLRDISSFDIQTRYHGWKSAYRLFGDRSFFKGILLFHAWHPVDRKSNYHREKEKNRKLFHSHMKRFQKKREHPTPLPSLDCGKTLLFRKNAFTFSPELRPLLGEVKLENEKRFPTKREFTDYVSENEITRILFHNPYANKEMQMLYDWARQERLPFVVAERGALNDSISFDTTGFLADSALFSEQYWNTPLDAARENQILEYIDQQHRAALLLEAQGARTSIKRLRKKLDITSSKKTILVCLQRPDDTATRFFEGEMGGYEDFISVLRKLSQELAEDFTLLVKVHPLERESPDIVGQDVSDYHLYDLLELADSLVVFNSGSGLQALMWDLPVITCGRAFYDHKDLTCHVSNYEELKKVVTGDVEVNKSARQRFLSYLLVEYYAFGKFVTRQTLMENGGLMTATTKIIYEVLRFEGVEGNYYRGRVEDDWKSMLFDRYLWQIKEKNRLFKKTMIPRKWRSSAVTTYNAVRNASIVKRLAKKCRSVYKWPIKPHMH